ncbi:unnamed protein product, partial [marine sediment metagenome]
IISFLGFTFASGEGKSIRVNQELKEKANIEYVDQRDAALEKDLDTYKADHVITHTLDNEGLLRLMDTHHTAQDEKLDLILLLIQAEHD